MSKLKLLQILHLKLNIRYILLSEPIFSVSKVSL